MIGNHKILGIAVVAILVTTAVMASSAQATIFTAGSNSGTVTLVQTTEQVLTMSVGTLRCSTANQEGPYSSSSFETLEVSANYSTCRTSGFLSWTVHMGTCKYKYTGAGQTGGKAPMDIVCSSGDITLTSVGCVVHIPAQSALGSVVFTNGGGPIPDDVNVSFNIEKIKYTETGGCPNALGGATTENGTLTGGATVRAFNAIGAQVHLTVD